VMFVEKILFEIVESVGLAPGIEVLLSGHSALGAPHFAEPFESWFRSFQGSLCQGLERLLEHNYRITILELTNYIKKSLNLITNLVANKLYIY
jgi:hypothetical protein